MAWSMFVYPYFQCYLLPTPCYLAKTACLFLTELCFSTIISGVIHPNLKIDTFPKDSNYDDPFVVKFYPQPLVGLPQSAIQWSPTIRGTQTIRGPDNCTGLKNDFIEMLSYTKKICQKPCNSATYQNPLHDFYCLAQPVLNTHVIILSY